VTVMKDESTMNECLRLGLVVKDRSVNECLELASDLSGRRSNRPSFQQPTTAQRIHKMYRVVSRVVSGIKIFLFKLEFENIS
jgi:hypothetical protein